MDNTDKIVPVNEGAEAFIEMLNANEVDHIFINPGTASVAIQEALSKYKALGKRAPEAITCLHEYVALSAAHGHFMVSGKPQVVLVHLTLGTQQMGGALLNAQRGRAGVVICATRVPTSRDGTGPGGRPFGVSWIHEQTDQAGIVRDYVKWEYELRSVETIPEIVQRAFRVASTEPCGPVYLVLPQDLLGQKMKEVVIPPIARYSAASTPQADEAVLEEVAGMLIQAEEPLIVTGYSGRNPQGVSSLVELAETLGARVVSSQHYMNFPTTHPLCGGFGPQQYMSNADVIFVIDNDLPYIPALASFKPGARLIYFDIDAVKPDFPRWGFAADILVGCDTSKTLPLLTRKIREKATPGDKGRFKARFQRLESEHEKQRQQAYDSAVEKSSVKPVSADWLCHCLNEIIDEDTIVVEETVSNRFAVLRHIQRTRPGTFFNSEGSSLGWALGAALGAKLASPESTVVSLAGDGTFIFGSPIPALWASNVYRAPFLCIVFNNRSYNVPRWAIRGAYGEGSYSEKTGYWVGVDIDPPPDYALIGEACGAYGRTVEDPAEVPEVLKNALEQVRQGKPAVVDVRLT
jgi:acetolactate synthase-1/2/3 large subunit